MGTHGGLRLAATLLVALAGLGAATASGAAAAWSPPGVGPGASRARTLATPTGVAAGCAVLLAGGIDITWTGAPDPVPGTQYVVERRRNGGAWSTVATVTTLTYRDSPGTLGTYDYRVTARVGAWAAPVSPVVSRTIISVVGLGLVCT